MWSILLLAAMHGFDGAAMWMSSHRGTRPLMFLTALTEERLAAIRGAALRPSHFVRMRPS